MTIELTNDEIDTVWMALMHSKLYISSDDERLPKLQKVIEMFRQTLPTELKRS